METEQAIKDAMDQLSSPLNLKCSYCGRVIRTKAGMLTHLQKNHAGSSRFDAYTTTAEPVAHVWKGQKKQKTKKIVQTPEETANLPSSKYIDVPIILRIPIHFGTVEIVNE